LFESAIFNMGMMIQAAQYKDYGTPYPINIREASNPVNAAWYTKDGRYVQTCMPDYNTYFKKFFTALGLDDIMAYIDCICAIASCPISSPLNCLA